MKKRIFGILLIVAVLCGILGGTVLAADTAVESELSAASAPSVWTQQNGMWYYVSDTGAKTTGWGYVDGAWYYFQPNGVMSTGWQYVDGAWYYFWSTGPMATGWHIIDGNWYYFWSGGSMAAGWQYIDGAWYYFGDGGAMATDWQWIDGSWYYFWSTGPMASNWLELDGTWYYLQSTGAMHTGWLKLGSTWYYFFSDGPMAAYCGAMIDGRLYYFDVDGVWIDYSLYVPEIQRAKKIDKNNYDSGRGMLLDIDENGVQDLVMVYLSGQGVQYAVCSVFTIQNGQVVTVMDQVEIGVAAGGPKFSAGIYQYNGERYFGLAYRNSGWDAPDVYWEGTYQLYTMNGSSVSRSYNIQWSCIENMNTDSIRNGTCSINGVDGSCSNLQENLHEQNIVCIYGDGATFSELIRTCNGYLNY